MKENQKVEKDEKNYFLLKSMNQKLNRTEELLKILIANELIDEVDMVFEGATTEWLEKCNKICKEKGASIQKEEPFYEKHLLYLQSKKGWSIKYLQEIKDALSRVDEKIVPVFIYERFHGTQKTMLERRKISYVVAGKEQHIYV